MIEGWLMKKEKSYMKNYIKLIEEPFDELELVPLTYDIKQQYLDMISENGDDLKATGFSYRFPISTQETFDNDLKTLISKSLGINLPEGKVPESSFFLLDKKRNRIVGAVNIRHKLNDYCRRRGGHIGYYICQEERNKGYGKIILKYALIKCKQLGINKILLTCIKDNIASAKVIIANGGMLETEVEENGVTLQKYWINNN